MTSNMSNTSSYEDLGVIGVWKNTLGSTKSLSNTVAGQHFTALKYKSSGRSNSKNIHDPPIEKLKRKIQD